MKIMMKIEEMVYSVNIPRKYSIFVTNYESYQHHIVGARYIAQDRRFRVASIFDTPHLFN